MKLKDIVIYALVALLVVWFLKNISASGSSSYMLRPMPVSLAAPGVPPGDMFKLQCSADCIPGPSEQASPYTKDLSPCGMCGIQKFVADQANYKLV